MTDKQRMTIPPRMAESRRHAEGDLPYFLIGGSTISSPKGKQTATVRYRNDAIGWGVGMQGGGWLWMRRRGAVKLRVEICNDGGSSLDLRSVRWKPMARWTARRISTESSTAQLPTLRFAMTAQGSCLDLRSVRWKATARWGRLGGYQTESSTEDINGKLDGTTKLSTLRVAMTAQGLCFDLRSVRWKATARWTATRSACCITGRLGDVDRGCRR